MGLNAQYKKEMINRYEKRFKKFGYHFKSVGWGNWETQQMRFKILSEIGDLNNASIVDLGCGFGDLCKYLNGHFKNFTYTGVDLVRELVEEGKRRYPQARFMVQDFLEKDFSLEGDYYLISGTLNSRLKGGFDYTEEILKKAFDLSHRGVAANFLTKYVDYELEKDLHHSPEAIFTFAKELSKCVTLRHDYPLWEFTVYLYKGD